MATESTEHSEVSPATGTRPKHSRWRMAYNILLVLVFLGCGGFGVFSLLNGDYLRGSLDSIFALSAGVQIASRIAGVNYATDFQNWLVKHPWLGVLFYCLLMVGMVVFIWFFALDLKNKGDQMRAAEYQARIQAAQPVKETQ